MGSEGFQGEGMAWRCFRCGGRWPVAGGAVCPTCRHTFTVLEWRTPTIPPEGAVSSPATTEETDVD